MAGVGDDRRAAAEALLGWYEAIGVDAIVLPDAVDRFAVPVAPPPQPAPPNPVAEFFQKAAGQLSDAAQSALDDAKAEVEAQLEEVLECIQKLIKERLNLSLRRWK